MQLPQKYDAVNAVIFASGGGSRRLRRTFVSFLGVSAGDRVLELGCGTGQVTAALVDAGASVVAVDRLPEMLDAARRRAPSANFVEADVSNVEPDGAFDVVVLSFLLHSFDVSARRALLRRSVAVLAADGHVGILDWSCPSGRVRGSLWRRFIARLEPSPTAADVLGGAIRYDLAAEGLEIARARSVAGHRAEMFAVQPARARAG